MLTDNETKVDLLNNEAIATTIIQLLAKSPEQATTIGVHGDWGAGKSSVLEMIEATLNGETDVACVKFNGWRFQGFEDAKIALIEGIVTELIDQRSLGNKAGEAVKNIFKRIDWLKVARRGGGLAFTALSGIPTADQIYAAVGTVKGALENPGELVTQQNYDAAIDGMQGLLKADDSKRLPVEIGQFREAFDELLDKAGVKQLVVLIDDLDRCLPDIAIETLEAVRLFLFTKRTAFIVAADEAMIEYSVRKHFPDLPDTTGPRDYARNYLEKLIQVPFRIPALGETETRIYVTLLLIGAELGEDDGDYLKLIGVARKQLERPWQAGSLDAATVRQTLGNMSSEVTNALTLSDQIGPILASGTQGNPRQIKRFLNTLLLRNQTAHARGFGRDVKLPVLAKLMLAERFMSRLFDQIASAAAKHENGHCRDLAALEADREQTAKPSEPSRKGSKRSNSDEQKKVIPDMDSALVSEWKSSDVVKAWAKLYPKIGEEDLRPYLFVAKDRKDYFGAASALGRLSAVVEHLMGSKLAAQAYESELRQLAPAEAGQVFEELRGRIVGGDSFDTVPAGVPGITVLVRAQDQLQSNLLDMLESLPAERCGAWAASGWAGVLKAPEIIARLDKLMVDWSDNGSPALRAAATAAKRTGAAGR